MKSRRVFLQVGALSLGAATLGFGSSPAISAGSSIALFRGTDDIVTNADCVTWALDHLAHILELRGFKVRRPISVKELLPREFCIVAESKTSSEMSGRAEALAITPLTLRGRPTIIAAGSDARGLMYALLELSDRVEHAEDPTAALSLAKPIVERPANEYRGVCRPFVSDVEDKPWLHDRVMWPDYFAMLATQRINRFHLALGLGYDFLKGVTDSYLLFSYPFLLDVPGYNVRAVGLPDAERDQNLAALQYISRQAALHGIDFQLGLWTHGYQFADSPNVNYTINGLNSENHAAYCRDALGLLLQKCPDVSGVTLRTHYESGVKEGNYGFWKTVFDGVPKSGRKLQIDLHVKGLDQQMLANATASGMPIMLTPKYWAEHMGLPYHQAAIRELEMPRRERGDNALMALSTGSRSFLRYGYGDLLREDRRYGVLHRIWPGTQRLLLWGDPAFAAAYSRAFSFCGSDGVEIFEPLGFKGRRGSGIAGSRDAYRDKSLQSHWDRQKYQYTFRVWGRLLYNPGAEPDIWERDLRKSFQAAAIPAEAALANASRILPIITTSHGASAANNTYWPEVYTNQPVVDPGKRNPYNDTPAPKVFGNVTPFDPQLFSSINEFAREQLKGERSGKYSPIEVAQWLEDLADAASKHLAQAEAQVPDRNTPEFRRLAIDVAIQSGLGRFFAAKFRSGVLYGIYESGGDRIALEESLKAYQRARGIWAQLAEFGKVYVSDITAGELLHLRGHWLDRLPAIDADIADMKKKLGSAQPAGSRQERAESAVAEALGRPRRDEITLRHSPPAHFVPGKPLEIELSLERPAKLKAARIYYRRVNQAERYQTAAMQPDDRRYRATISANYTQSPYALQYYFELQESPDRALLYPGFGPDLSNQPYFVIRRG